MRLATRASALVAKTTTRKAAPRAIARKGLPSSFFNVGRQQQQFHAGSPTRAEEESKGGEAAVEVKDPKDELFMANFWGNPWYSVPVGFLAFATSVHRGWYNIDEETQLSVLFFLFIGTVYSQGGAAVAEMLDSTADAIKEEHQAAEVAKINMLGEVREAHKDTADLATHISSLYADLDAIVAENCEVAAKAAMLEMRSDVVKKLDTVSRAEQELSAQVQSDLVNKAAAHVRSIAPSMADEALTSALEQLANPESTVKDPVQAAFADYIKQWTARIESTRNEEQEASEKAVENANFEAKSIASRDGLEQVLAGMKVNTKVAIGDF